MPVITLLIYIVLVALLGFLAVWVARQVGARTSGNH
jgi:uncharacterized membrane protein (DUF485 family)